MTSPAELSLCDAAERIRSRELSSREVTARLHRAHRAPRRCPQLLHPLRRGRGSRPGRRGGPGACGRGRDRPSPRRAAPRTRTCSTGRGWCAPAARRSGATSCRTGPPPCSAGSTRPGPSTSGGSTSRSSRTARPATTPTSGRAATPGTPRTSRGGLVERLGVVGGGPPRVRGARLGYGRLGPPSRRRQRPRRHQADPDPGEPPRDDGPLVLPRQRGAAHPHGARRGPAPRGHRGPRPGGRDEQPPARAGLRGGDPRPRRPGGSGSGCRATTTTTRWRPR